MNKHFEYYLYIIYIYISLFVCMFIFYTTLSLRGFV